MSFMAARGGRGGRGAEHWLTGAVFIVPHRLCGPEQDPMDALKVWDWRDKVDETWLVEVRLLRRSLVRRTSSKSSDMARSSPLASCLRWKKKSSQLASKVETNCMRR